ncbi:predicted protein [Arabidopsis lyrata subsp. lyrata]|uniref:Predicted protein n=1 Tax=Arabidopsis lyrata subsp. lyrata TaxID=81972 RepID=D7LNC6_ARALL|nr:predicted protein [Arabidopsis lyrata subsp. lyrata]
MTARGLEFESLYHHGGTEPLQIKTPPYEGKRCILTRRSRLEVEFFLDMRPLCGGETLARESDARRFFSLPTTQKHNPRSASSASPFAALLAGERGGLFLLHLSCLCYFSSSLAPSLSFRFRSVPSSLVGGSQWVPSHGGKESPAMLVRLFFGLRCLRTASAFGFAAPPSDGFLLRSETRWCIALVFPDLLFVGFLLGWAFQWWSRDGGSPLLGLSFFCFPSSRWRCVRFWLLGSFGGRTRFGFSDPILCWVRSGWIAVVVLGLGGQRLPSIFGLVMAVVKVRVMLEWSLLEKNRGGALVNVASLIRGRWFLSLYRNGDRRWFLLLPVDAPVTVGGCRVMEVNRETSYDQCIQMVFEDYGLQKRVCDVVLSYEISKMMSQSLPGDTPPVFISNSRQFHTFLGLLKSNTIRLCVEVKRKNSTHSNEIDNEGVTANKFQRKRGRNENVMEEEEETDLSQELAAAVEVDEEDEEIRFDYCDDSDGTDSDDGTDFWDSTRRKGKT